jgi:hypothetical protein
MMSMAVARRRRRPWAAQHLQNKGENGPKLMSLFCTNMLAAFIPVNGFENVKNDEKEQNSGCL